MLINERRGLRHPLFDWIERRRQKEIQHGIKQVQGSLFKRRNRIYERRSLICVDRKKENLYIHSQRRQLHRRAG